MSTKASKKTTPSVKKTDKVEKQETKQDTPKKVDEPVAEQPEPDVADVDPDAEVEVVDDTEQAPVEEDNAEEDAEEDEPAEEEDEESSPKKGSKKPAKKGSKVVAKKGKTTAKKAATKKEPSEEQKRYDAAMKAAVEASYVNDFEALKPRSVHDKCGGLLTMYILEAVNQLQQDEVVDDKSYNPYPSSKYVLLEDKLSGTTASKGKSVKKTGESSGKPSKKRLPPKRGQKKVEEPEPEEEEEKPEAEDNEEKPEAEENDAEKDEEKSEDNEEDKDGKETKTKARSNVVTINRNGKTYLGFIMMRFVDELYSTDGGKNVRSSEDFTKFTMEKISKDINSHLARAIVSTVNRYERRVAGMPDHTFQKDIGARFDEFFEDRSSIAKYLSDYLMKYYKLLAQSIASDLWISHKGVNGQTIEKAMRQLNNGNYEYMVDSKFVVEGASDFGLTRGVLHDAREFDRLLNPPPAPLTEAEKKERAEKRKKTAADKAAGKAPAKKAPKGKKGAAKKAAPKAAGKGAKKATTKKSGKNAEEEPEEQEEQEEEQEEAGAEEVEAEAEPEEEEPEAEEPAEEVPVKKDGAKKVLKKL